MLCLLYKNVCCVVCAQQKLLLRSVYAIPQHLSFVVGLPYKKPLCLPLSVQANSANVAAARLMSKQ